MQTARSAALTEGFQTLKQGLTVICNAPLQAPQEWKKAEAAESAMILAKWIEDNLKNTQAIRLFSALASADPASKVTILRQAAKQAGVDICPLADMLAP